jgi:phosphoenolpyruvate---glycerone phosphotransferase subunit DhaL
MRLRDVQGGVMAIDGDALRAMMAAVAADMEASRDELCRLDGVIGDADHGIAMALGFAAARDAVAAMEPLSEPTAVLNMAAKAFLNAVGASSGPLYATALMRAGAAVKGKAALEDADVVAMLQAMAVGIRDRGKVEPGEKTMLDAWAPAALAAAEAQAAGRDLAGCLDAAAAAAREGAEATRGMVATKGRAERLGERAVGHVDPGAASAAVVIEAMRRSLSS